MIQSAMLFALGFFVSGLIWLALSTALVRRARRLTERRLLASLSTRRAEFEAERDELRARHAVQMHRLERQVSRVLDQATAHRLEADLKERDLLAAQADLQARDEDFEEFQENLARQNEALQDLERRHAEAGTALRATQHALKMEHGRRSALEAALDQAEMQAEQQRLQLNALSAENAMLRAAEASQAPGERDGARVARIGAPGEMVEAVSDGNGQRGGASAGGQHGGSVVALPTRPRAAPEAPPDPVDALIADAARDLQRLEGEAHGGFGEAAWRAPANVVGTSAAPTPPPAIAAEPGTIAGLGARRSSGGAPAPAPPPPGAKPEIITRQGTEENAETRFREALKEIRALKRAASQAGE